MTFDAPGPRTGEPPAPKKAVRPRDAATLILTRQTASGPKVLMGQRHAGHKFMPNKFVFPGGRADPADLYVRPATDLRPEDLTRLQKGSGPRKSRALALAAIRETFEETGLTVGQPLAAPPKKAPGPWADFYAAGAEPRLDILDFIARAITPPYRASRFDARFFMADAAHIIGRDPDALEGSGELLKLHWVPLADALALDLPNITKVVVGEIKARLGAPAAPRPVPFYFFRHGKSVVEYL